MGNDDEKYLYEYKSKNTFIHKLPAVVFDWKETCKLLALHKVRTTVLRKN